MCTLIPLILLCTALSQVVGDGTLEIEFVEFTNPDGQGSNDQCCDGRGIFCESGGGCDHYFKGCFSPLNSAEHSCSLKQFTTTAYENRNEITFGSTIGDIANPLVIPFEEWDGGVQIKVEIFDQDGSNNDDHVDTMTRNSGFAAARNKQTAIKMIVNLSSKTRLSLHVSAYCSAGYYGSRCAVLCRPQDRPGAHYSCHQQTGAKLCLPGWQGAAEDCAQEVDECSSDPCHNNATCIDHVNAFQCNCTDGYAGVLCDEDIDECSSDPCQNNATCDNFPGGYSCNCTDGWTGHNCDVEVDECASSPCLNNATCLDEFLGYECACAEGWAGRLCEEDVDECNTTMAHVNMTHENMTHENMTHENMTHENMTQEPCLSHNHTCENHAGGYSCVCPSGYAGDMCEHEIDECESAPCLNQGNCTDLLADFACQCPSNYTGSQCETFDVCLYAPCAEGSTCVIVNGSEPVCVCAQGFQGLLCEEDVDECNSTDDTCLHGGLCSNLHGGFLCECAPGYHGNHCEKQQQQSGVAGIIVGVAVAIGLCTLLGVLVTRNIKRMKLRPSPPNPEVDVCTAQNGQPPTKTTLVVEESAKQSGMKAAALLTSHV